MRTAEINLAILRFAGRHHGLITTEAGRRSGIDADSLLQRATTGMLERLDRDLFRLAGSPDTWEQRALAACWSQGPEAMLSHRAAALLWDLDGITEAPLEVLLPRGRRRRRRPNVRIH
jgi:hypothetical protein